MLSCGCFKIAAPKTLENIQKMYVIEFPFTKIVRLRSTVYYQIKESTTDPFFGVAGFLKVF